MPVENCGEHETFVQELADAFLVGLDSDDAVLRERAAA